MKEIDKLKQIASDLLERSNLQNIIKISFDIPEYWNNLKDIDIDAYFYYPSIKTIFIIHELVHKDYEMELYLNETYEQLQKEDKLNFDTYYKILVAHELGHAKQNEELFQQLEAFISLDELNKITDIEVLNLHFDKYKDFLLKMETEAWDIAWSLLSSDTNFEIFNIIKKYSLDSYENMSIDEDIYFSNRYYELIEI